MPLVTIESLPPPDPTAIPKMLSEVREWGAKALKCPESNIWVTFRPVSADHHGQHPPVVIVRAKSGRAPAERDAFATAVTTAVGRGLAVPPDGVWLHYQEMRPEDVWFEGHWSG